MYTWLILQKPTLGTSNCDFEPISTLYLIQSYFKTELID